MKQSILKALVSVALLAVFIMLAACVFVPTGRHGSGVVMVPPLPAIVVLEEEPYYFHSGYYYYYDNDRWFYSHEKRGPWIDLPRGHYPKDVRFKGRHDDRDKGWKHGHDD